MGQLTSVHIEVILNKGLVEGKKGLSLSAIKTRQWEKVN
jgi:hypothetical protein